LNELNKALKIQEKVLGKEHSSTKNTQSNIDYLKKEMMKNNERNHK